jgi:lipopolysaccharide/colanic/teichoic acid biosynthesis glycosyltransferase
MAIQTEQPSTVAEQVSVIAAEAYSRRPVDFVLRGLDLAIAGSALILLSPLLALLALATLLTSGRPVLYRGQRVGQAGHVFTMYKLRTLRPGAEARLGNVYGEELSRRTEEEVTMVGKAARLTHIDEVPQLFNVLRGDMSLVGPRPPLPLEVDRYTMTQSRRLRVRPGLTGLWQVSGRSDLSWTEAIRLDLYYVDNWSMIQDLVILGRTLGAVLTSRGAY